MDPKTYPTEISKKVIRWPVSSDCPSPTHISQALCTWQQFIALCEQHLFYRLWPQIVAARNLVIHWPSVGLTDYPRHQLTLVFFLCLPKPQCKGRVELGIAKILVYRVFKLFLRITNSKIINLEKAYDCYIFTFTQVLKPIAILKQFFIEFTMPQLLKTQLRLR